MRSKLRIVKLYPLLKDPEIFEHFTGGSREQYELFLQNYEILLLSHYDEYDLRIIQHLFNQGIIDDEYYYREESTWFVEQGYIKLENIATWKSWGLDLKERIEEWKKNAPKINEPLKDWEFGYYVGDKNYTIYAKKYCDWMKFKPTSTERYLIDLDSSHIENILLTQTQISPTLRQTFQKILDERQKGL